jgi:hypothetical protein
MEVLHFFPLEMKKPGLHCSSVGWTWLEIVGGIGDLKYLVLHIQMS